MIAAALLGSAGFFRNLGIGLVFPFPEGIIGVGARLGIALALTVPALNLSELKADAIEIIEISIAQIAFEITFGMLCGLPLLAVYHSVRIWGDLLESLRGQQIGALIDPLTGGEEQPFSVLASQTVLYLVTAEFLFPFLLRIQRHSFEHYAPMRHDLSSLSTCAESAALALQVVLGAFMAASLPFAVFAATVECGAALISKVCSGVGVSGETYTVRLAVFSAALLLFGDQIFFGFAALLERAALPW